MPVSICSAPGGTSSALVVRSGRSGLMPWPWAARGHRQSSAVDMRATRRFKRPIIHVGAAGTWARPPRAPGRQAFCRHRASCPSSADHLLWTSDDLSGTWAVAWAVLANPADARSPEEAPMRQSKRAALLLLFLLTTAVTLPMIPTAEAAGPGWAEQLQAMDEALGRGDAVAAQAAWREAY